MYTIHVLRGPDRGRSLQLDSGRVAIGTGSDMDFVLSDPETRPCHLVLSLAHKTWQARAFDHRAAVIIERGWHHPTSQEQGAYVYVGASKLLLYPGYLSEDALKHQPTPDETATIRDDDTCRIAEHAMEFQRNMRGKPRKLTAAEAPPLRPEKLLAPVPVHKPHAFSDSHRNALAERAGMRPIPEGVVNRPVEDDEVPDPEPVGGRGRMTISLSDTAVSALPKSSHDLFVLYAKDSHFAKELRVLASRMIELSRTAGVRSILFTSVGDQEGKTVTAANTALVMSEDHDRKVALVDANLRQPRLKRLFNLRTEHDLVSALKHRVPLEMCATKVDQRNLLIVPSRRTEQPPPQLLGSQAFKSLMKRLSQAVDFMIVDAPSARPHADVVMLAKHVDRVVIVASKKRTHRTELDQVLELIGRDRVAGSVFMGSSRA